MNIPLESECVDEPELPFLSTTGYYKFFVVSTGSRLSGVLSCRAPGKRPKNSQKKLRRTTKYHIIDKTESQSIDRVLGRLTEWKVNP
jgi:hypothetical protein